MRVLPTGWSTERHRCDVPTVVYFKPECGDIYTCKDCHRQWQIFSISGTGSEGYDRYKIALKPVNIYNDYIYPEDW